MGKKARKTRWRTLAIETGNQSDSDESNNHAVDDQHPNQKNYYHSQHYNANTHYQNGNGGQHHGGGYAGSNGYQQHYGGVQRSYRSKYGTSTPTHPRGRFGGGHHYAPSHYHYHGQQMHQQLNGANDSNSKTSTTTSSTTTSADGKITFNEDEYTRITTPRQDVLFKKGYLNKPKTYQTQTSTGNSTISTGNSTGNGTPDHQSADGTEGTDLEYESQFVFPNGFVDQNGIYFINSYEPYPPQLVMYNPQMCYPEYIPSTRSKRLSTGSLTESTSPHNEETSQELSHSGGETVSYPEYGGNHVYNVVIPGYFYSNGVPAEMELVNGEPRKIKKRRRRKLSKPVPEDGWTSSSDYDDSEEMVSEIENRIIQGTHRPPATDSPPTADGSNEEENGDGAVVEEEEEASAASAPAAEVVGGGGGGSSSKMVLKPDAKEFIPRSFIHHHHIHHAHHPARHHQMSPPFIANLIPLPPSFLPVPPMHHIPPPPPTPATPLAEVPPPFVDQSSNITVIATTTSCGTPTLQELEPVEEAPVNDAKEALTVVPAPASTPAVPEKQPEVVQKVENTTATPEQTNKNIDIAKIVSKLEEAAKEQKAKTQKPQNRPKRTFSRPLQVELNVDTKRNAIKIDTTKSTSPGVMHSGKNYAQMLRNRGGRTPTSPASPLRTNPTKANDASHSTTPTHQNSAHQRAPAAPQPKVQNQWIAVQSRKKRKNKAQGADWDEVEPAKEEQPTTKPEVPIVGEDGFEKYDINQLEDVVVDVKNIKDKDAAIIEEEDRKAEDNKIVANQVPEVPQIVEVVQIPDVQKTSEDEEFDKLIKTLEELEAKTPKKKPSQKSNTKRIIITDSVEITQPEVKTPQPVATKKTPKVKSSKAKTKDAKVVKEVKEVKETKPNKADCLPACVQEDQVNTIISTDSSEAVILPEVVACDTPVIEKPTKEEVVPKVVEEVIIKEEEPPKEMVTPIENKEEPKEERPSSLPLEVTTAAIELEGQLQNDTPEKKRKKKKKPAKKLASSESSTPSTSIATPTASGGSEETSYDFLLTDSLLREDERTNVEVSEELDKIIQRGMYNSLEEKIRSLNITAANDGFFKSMTSLVASTTSRKPREDDLTSVLTNTTNIFKAKRTYGQLPTEPTTTGSFLDVANIQVDPGISPPQQALGGDEYPITRAVKDWMVRTRETTPEVELLKSPKTILRELNHVGVVEVVSKPVDEDDATASLKESWSFTPQSSFDDDLLECWEDLEDNAKMADPTPPVNGEKTGRDETQLAQEALEVYESMYGKNEDFKKIKAEIEEKKRNGTLPKHGQLPYRAICCSVM